MTNRSSTLGSFVCFALLAAGKAFSADTPPAELERLRSALRETTLQLRSAQADLATAQASLAASEEQKKQASAKAEALQKQLDAEQAATRQTQADLNKRLNAGTAENGRLSSELDRAKAEWAKTAQLAQATETERRRLAEESDEQKRRILTLQAKNVALFLVANEILTRFADFSVGNAVKAKDPFVGSARARLETLVQDYRDKITDERDRP